MPLSFRRSSSPMTPFTSTGSPFAGQCQRYKYYYYYYYCYSKTLDNSVRDNRKLLIEL
jgi:hypothetical protein